MESVILLYMTDPSTISAADCLGIIEEALPSRLQQSLLRAVFEDYRAAYDSSYTEYDPQQARDINGHLRRANIERDLLGIGKRFKDLQVKAEFYKNGTGSYVRLMSGAVILTQSAVQSPDSPVRSAEFRKSLAGNPQLSLNFGGLEAAEDDVPGQYLYVILLHGKDVKDRSRPAFVQLVVPSADCSMFVARVDLYKKFPEIVNAYVPSAETASPEIQLVARKNNQKKQA